MIIVTLLFEITITITKFLLGEKKANINKFFVNQKIVTDFVDFAVSRCSDFISKYFFNMVSNQLL